MADKVDITVIGGGPAGMMAALQAASLLGDGFRVRLFDKNDHLGRKIYLTGKGKCNLTNSRPWNEFSEHIHPSAQFFKPAFFSFSNEETVRFFESIGVPCTELQGKRIFPASLRAADVAQSLENRLRELGVDICYGTAVVCGETAGDGADGSVALGDIMSESRAVIIATGGKSYPVTGSTGDGYAMAEALGHTVTRTFPSETALLPKEYYIGEVVAANQTGNSAQPIEMKNVGLSLIVDKDIVQTEQGDFNFTADGLESGIAYWLSRRAVWAMENGQKVTVVMDLKPALTLEKLAARIARDVCDAPGKPQMNKILRGLMPEVLIEPFKKQNPDLSFENLASRLKNWRFPITGFKGYDRAVVTAGGVNSKEIVPKTLASRIRPGLFFAGEVLDLDGDTGGYNLQIAFSTGALAGVSAAKYVQKCLPDAE